MSQQLSQALPEDLVPVVRRFRDAALSQSTRAAYLSALRSWVVWCLSFTPARSPWPVDATGKATGPGLELVEGYIADLARRGYALATVHLAIAALGEATKLAGLGAWRRELKHYLEDRGTLKGVRRTLGKAPKRRARPLLTRELAECLRTLPSGTEAGIRDRAILEVGWACTLRASDLAGLWYPRDVRAFGTGYVLGVRRSKTDQEGAGEEIRIACSPGEVCPACALRRWLEVRGDLDGPLFGVSRALVSRVVKRAARRLGLDPSEFSSHSLRAGGITSFDDAGVSEGRIGRVSRHRSTRQLREYVRGAQLLREPTPAELTLERFSAANPSESQPLNTGPASQTGEDVGDLLQGDLGRP